MTREITRRALYLALAAGLVLPVHAGAQASSDIFLAEVSGRGAGPLRLGAPVNLTLRPGYDNQPHFTPDGGSILYTSIRETQADVYRLELSSRTQFRLTQTRESEYSATPVRGGGFSVIRVESDSTQRLWHVSDDGQQTRLLLPEVAPVGYHAWGEGDRVAVFVLGSPPTLHWIDMRSGEREVMAEDIGRTIQRVPGRDAISFVQRLDARSFIVELDMHTRRLRKLTETVPGGDYHAWLPDGTLLMSSGSRILHHDLRTGSRWREVADLGPQGLRVTRLAVSPTGDRVAFVGEALR
jgi:hypothetical protein